MTTHRFAAIPLAAAIACFAIGLAQAQQAPEGPPVTVWGPNGSVTAITRVGQTLVVGGTFDYVGPPTGAFVTVGVDDAAAVQATAPAILGPAQLSAGDQAGGWFVVERPERQDLSLARIVHVRADGSRDSAWRSPSFASTFANQPASLNAITLHQGRVFVSGLFTSVDGAPRTGLAALSATTGELLPWNVQILSNAVPHAPAIAAAVAGRIYINGAYYSVNGVSRNGRAAVDAETGAVLPFDISGPTAAPVKAVTSSTVYAGCMAGLCAYDLTGVPVPSWTPFPVSDPVIVTATPTAVYVTVQEANAHRVVALDALTGARRSWPEPVVAGSATSAGAVAAMQAAGGRLYLAGDFLSVNGVARRHAAAVDEASGAVLPWAPHPGALIYSLSVQGDRVALGGAFNSVGGVPRRNLVALDLASGRPRPTPDAAFDVLALHAIGEVVVVAGGRSLGQAIAFAATTGASLPWSLSANASISALASGPRYLYLGGSFTSVNGQARTGLAAIDLATATLAPQQQFEVGSIGAMAVADGTLYASGFGAAPGQNRAVVAVFDAATFARLPFAPSPPPAIVQAIGVASGRVLLVGSMGREPQQADWFDATSGQLIPRVTAQSFTAGRVGRFGSTMLVTGATMPRLRPAAELIDIATGASAAWDPQLAGGLGNLINAVHADDDYVVLAGAFDRAAGGATANLAVFRAPRAGAPLRLTTLVAGQTVTLRWQPGPSPVASAFIVEAGTSPGAVDVGRFNVGLGIAAAGALPSGRYFVRVRAVSASGEGRGSSEVIIDLPPTSAAPSVPGLLTAAVTGQAVALSWGAAAGNATEYVVEVGTASGLANLAVFPTGHLDTSFVTAAPAGTYHVRIRARNVFGLGPASNEVTVVVP